MQNKDEQTLYLRKILGETIRQQREKMMLSGNKLTNEFDLGSGNLSRIENSLVDCKFVTVWKISEALGLKFSEFAKLLEENLGGDFKLIDE